MKSNCVFQKPLTFEDLGDGRYYYNFHVVETEKKDPETGEVTPSFDYDQVVIVGKPTYHKVVAAVIRDKYSVDDELALINNYNESLKAKTKGNPESVKEYEEYLVFRTETKEMVKTDCIAYNILIEE